MMFAKPSATGRGKTPWLLLLLLFTAAPARAADEDLATQLAQLGSTDRAVRAEALQKLGRTRDGRLVAFFAAYQQGDAYLYQDRVVLCPKFQEVDGQEMAPLFDPLSNKPLLDSGGAPLLVLAGELNAIGPSGRERRAVADAVRLLEIWSNDLQTRLAAIRRFGNSRKSEFLKPLGELVAADVPETVRSKATESIALIELGSEDFADSPAKRIAAAVGLGEMASAAAVPILGELLKNHESLGPGEHEAFSAALETIEWYQWKIARVQNLFQGLSLGSVLILVALGLAIIFGQMGVINMAHGELMMIGAYATFEIQMLFGHTPDNPVNMFFVVALPVSFLVAAFVGWLIELLIVRHLYGRPLETLLATWGVGLILIQSVRLLYGDNIGVNSPTWLIGSFEPIQDLVISYNRIFIMALCAACVLAISAVMNGTRRGLLIRATVQNRETAESLGVNTRRTDGLTFALGAGLAGIAGCAWTLIGGVTPDMGQNHIVDAFLVVVTGGVGKLSGTVCAGLGIGTLNKILEPLTLAEGLRVLSLVSALASWIMVAVQAFREQTRLGWLALIPIAGPLLVLYQHRTLAGVRTGVTFYGIGLVGFGLSFPLAGTLNEPIAAIWAKVILLLLVIVFIQWKPAGLFPPKGRLADV